LGYSMTGTITINCPKMGVVPTDNPLVHDTTELVCPVTITRDDGTVLDGQVVYPVCPVKFVKPGLWRVDQVTASGKIGNWDIAVTLEPEDVIWDGIGKRKALECKGTGAIWDHSILSFFPHVIATISLVSPAVESWRDKIGEFFVDPCVETGEVIFSGAQNRTAEP
jgi:hypothetical protein